MRNQVKNNEKECITFPELKQILKYLFFTDLHLPDELGHHRHPDPSCGDADRGLLHVAPVPLALRRGGLRPEDGRHRGSHLRLDTHGGHLHRGEVREEKAQFRLRQKKLYENGILQSCSLQHSF